MSLFQSAGSFKSVSPFFACSITSGNLNVLSSITGLQKDRDRGTAGPKEGLSSIGRFRMNSQDLSQILIFLKKIGFRKARLNLTCILNKI